MYIPTFVLLLLSAVVPVLGRSLDPRTLDASIDPTQRTIRCSTPSCTFVLRNQKFHYDCTQCTASEDENCPDMLRNPGQMREAFRVTADVLASSVNPETCQPDNPELASLVKSIIIAAQVIGRPDADARLEKRCIHEGCEGTETKPSYKDGNCGGCEKYHKKGTLIVTCTTCKGVVQDVRGAFCKQCQKDLKKSTSTKRHLSHESGVDETAAHAPLVKRCGAKTDCPGTTWHEQDTPGPCGNTKCRSQHDKGGKKYICVACGGKIGEIKTDALCPDCKSKESGFNKRALSRRSAMDEEQCPSLITQPGKFRTTLLGLEEEYLRNHDPETCASNDPEVGRELGALKETAVLIGLLEDSGVIGQGDDEKLDLS